MSAVMTEAGKGSEGYFWKLLERIKAVGEVNGKEKESKQALLNTCQVYYSGQGMFLGIRYALVRIPAPHLIVCNFGQIISNLLEPQSPHL